MIRDYLHECCGRLYSPRRTEITFHRLRRDLNLLPLNNPQSSLMQRIRRIIKPKSNPRSRLTPQINQLLKHLRVLCIRSNTPSHDITSPVFAFQLNFHLWQKLVKFGDLELVHVEIDAGCFGFGDTVVELLLDGAGGEEADAEDGF